MPGGKKAWSNFPNVLYTAHAVYCALEGLSRTSDKAREVLLFFFYGLYCWETKLYKTNSEGKRVPTETVLREKPLIFHFHKKLVSGRSRYHRNIELNFAKFINAYNLSDGAWEKFLTDHGEGSPPVEFNIFLEDGLRLTALSDIYTMGLRPLRSREHWARVGRERKLELWIAVGRFCLKLSLEYKQWDCYVLADFINRQALMHTFEKRNLPLSDGCDEKNFENMYTFDWDKHATAPSPVKVKSEPTTVAPTTKVVSAHVDLSGDGPAMVYDPIKGCLVPFE